MSLILVGGHAQLTDSTAGLVRNIGIALLLAYAPESFDPADPKPEPASYQHSIVE